MDGSPRNDAEDVRPAPFSIESSFWILGAAGQLSAHARYLAGPSSVRSLSLKCCWPGATDVLFSGPYVVRQPAVTSHIPDYSWAGPVNFGAIGISGRLRSLRILLNCVTPLFISSSNWVRRVRI
jgi:hypothetical protein